MSGDRFRIITASKHGEFRDLVRGLTRIVWPEFMLHDAVANENWHELLDRFADFQFALYDSEKRHVAGMGNSFPLRWDDALENLPDGGWDWAFTEAVKNHKQGVSPNLHCAIQIILHPDYRSQGLSPLTIQAVRAVTKAQGLPALIIPIRPSEKSHYPLTSMDDYVTWDTDDGLPFDAWLRAHVRLGATVIKVCHRSKTVRGSRAEWETWTRMKFPQSGRYIVPGALDPIEMNIEKDEGVYTEQNVWIVHEVN
jgi:GNAT superfamily N-acetyltransferase